MARNENAPFERGALGTYYSEPGTVDATGGSWKQGMEFVFEDKDYSVSPAADRTGLPVTCRIVRNESGGALLPKRFGKFQLDGTPAQYAGSIDAHGDTVGQVGGVIDEFLPAAGVPDNELFWLTVEGPSEMVTGASGDTNIALGAMVIPTTDGKVIDQDVTVAAGAATFNQIQGAVGRAMQAINATDTDILICVRRMQ